jgi:ATP-dependent helicase HrpB
VTLSPLPIDDVLPQIVAAVRARRACVLVAPPGAGKTTRVPGALLDAGVVDGAIVVLQPRRLAARLAAARIASERGAALGDEVGYTVRFDRRATAATRIELVTEGVLARRLAHAPELHGVGCVIVDEFHERHLDGDLALALVARLRARRPELAIVVMSATLDPEPVARFLDDAPVVRSEGRAYPVAIGYAAAPDDRPLEHRVASAVRELVRDGVASPAGRLDGDVLVFLPGAAEIRRCGDALDELARTHDLVVLPLHGDLPAEQQDLAVRPNARRKIVLATNVAETSVTIDGVAVVIDSGLARVARHSPWSGIARLEIESTSQASCAQRAGRAGRTRPGRAIRLYTKHDHDTRRAFDTPEIARADLATAALELRAAGLAFDAVRWLEPPPAAARDAAERLLVRLGAVDEDRGITELGRRMLRFPVHPRLARLVVEAERLGVAREGCTIAALLGGRELRRERRDRAATARVASSSDVIDDLDAFEAARRGGLRADRLRADGLDVATAFAVERAAAQLARLVDARGAAPSDIDRALQLAILAAFPDRVGKRRSPGSADVVLAAGGSGTLAASSAVIDAELLVAVDAGEIGGRGQQARISIRRASAIEASWLLDLYVDRVSERDELTWNAKLERVERVQQLVYDGLAIDESRAPAPPDRAAAELLAKRALDAGLARFADPDALAQWRARVAFAATLAPQSSLQAPTDVALADVLARACDGLTSFAELRVVDLVALLDASLGAERALVDRLAPTHLALPRRRRVPIRYELDRPPWIASRLQDFFGLPRAPTVGEGRVPLVLHLLAPNQRPVQVTTDLPGFWRNHYPALRRELARKYPRHAWPEDPTLLVEE